MIPAPEALAAALDALNAVGSPFMLTGSIASSAYGEPRSTIDADFVVVVEGDEVAEIAKRLSGDFEREGQVSFETVTGKVQHQFRHRSSKFLIEIFEADLSDPHEQERFERRKKVSLLERSAWFPTAEDVIIQKLRWYAKIRRNKDRDDLARVMQVQWDNLDWAYIERWCGKHDTIELFQQIRSEVKTQLDC